MPQIAQISEIFASQLFWLVLTFGLIYVVIGRGMLPKIEGVVDKRNRQIADDLAAADAARSRADEIEESYQARAAENRAEAQKLVVAARETSAREGEGRIAEADAAIGARIAAAEAEVRTAMDAAVGDIEAVAAEAAEDMVAKLTGVAVTRERAAQAVKAELNHG
ncbi:MAG: ATPase [Allosphingosinicella sp.]